MNEAQKLISKDPDSLSDAECLLLFEEMKKDPEFFMDYIHQHSTGKTHVHKNCSPLYCS